MSKPTDEELKIALRAAAEMKEHNADHHFLAKTLLNHHFRLSYMEEVLAAADKYINHGMIDRDRLDLIHAINQAQESEDRTSGTRHDDFGLG